MDDPSTKAAAAVAGKLTWFGVLGVVACVCAIAVAALVPIAPGGDDMGPAARGGFEVREFRCENAKELVLRMAGRRLLRPAQVKAAVKDTGTAARLARKLRLQGVVRMGDRLNAYVEIQNQGVRAVGEGDKVLDFVVKRIEPGKITLSLQGVEVVLGH